MIFSVYAHRPTTIASFSIDETSIRNTRIGCTFFRFLLRYHVRNRTFVTSRSLDRKRKSKKSKVGRQMRTVRGGEVRLGGGAFRSKEGCQNRRDRSSNRFFQTIANESLFRAKRRRPEARGEERQPKAEILPSLYGPWFDRAVRRSNEFRKTETRPNGLTPNYPFSTRPA